MGSRASKEERKLLEEIRCNPAVTHQDINRYRDYCPQKCDKCRQVMHKSLLIVTETEESVRKDFEITCYCEHFSSCFSSGGRKNKIVVQMTAEGKIHVTTEDRSQKRKIEEIDCSPAVTHQDINEYIEYCLQKCDKCRYVMQKARLIVTKTGESVRKSFEIMCYCEHFSLCFLSGKRENKIVVQMFEGKIHDTTTDRSSWEKLMETLRSGSWSGVLRIVVDVVGEIIGTMFGEDVAFLTNRALLTALPALAHEVRHN